MNRGNQFYSVDLDTEKNRIYFSMTGDVPSVDVVSNFESDWKETVAGAKPGFTILGDLSKSGKLKVIQGVELTKNGKDIVNQFISPLYEENLPEKNKRIKNENEKKEDD